MKVSQGMEIKQGMKLSPQMLAELKLLEYPVVALEQRIREEIESNPAFDVDELVLENKYESEEHPDDMEGEKDPIGDDESRDFSPDDDDYDDCEGHFNNPKYRGDDDDSYQIQIRDEISKSDFLRQQLDYKDLNAKQKRLCQYIIGSLDDRGFINSEIERMADDYAMAEGELVDEDEIRFAIDTVKTLEPAGVGAQGLKECFLLQLEKLEENEDVLLLKRIINEHFKSLTECNFDVIKSRLGVDDDMLKSALKVMRKLNPSPLGSFSDSAQVLKRTISPDFLIEENDGEIVVSLNDGNIPAMKVSEQYQKMANGQMSRVDRQTVRFAQEYVGKADWFIGAIAQRQRTLMTIMVAIAEFQKDYFLTGDFSKLRPMHLKDIEDETGLDSSTVSRATSNKYMQTSYGIIPLKSMFSDVVRTVDGEDMSNRQIKEILLEIVDGEDKNNPYSDSELARILTERGIAVARRTIAKYREQMGIPTGQTRKLVKRNE